MRDEIIEEVHAAKEALAAQCGFDIRRIFEDIKHSETQTEAEGWHHIQPIHNLPHSTFQHARFMRHLPSASQTSIKRKNADR